LVRLAPPASYQRSTPGAYKATAAPRCISGRTSYLHVRLIFHPYPQLIRAFCNRHRFGPPRPVTGASTWPWVAHVVSGQRDATKRACHTRFRCGSGFDCLSLATPRYSPDHTPKGTQLEHEVPSTACRRTVSGSISLPSPGCFSPFPHGTLRYRSVQVPRLGGVVPPASAGISRVPAYLRWGRAGDKDSTTGLSPCAALCSKQLRLG
jgi:hypothetical protein